MNIYDGDIIVSDRKKNEIVTSIESQLKGLFGVGAKSASMEQKYKAVARVLRNDIMERWAYSKDMVLQEKGKRLYYLSMEFLPGRALGNNLLNLGLTEAYQEACDELGIDLNAIRECEPDAGLGNGGLGRLASCFLESLATLRMVGHGQGIRYEYGLFKQKIVDGYQVEFSDPWLENGFVWEVPKPEEAEFVNFGGKVKRIATEDDRDVRFEHYGYQTVKAIPYDVPTVGYCSPVVNTLRLWGARSAEQLLDMESFNKGDYVSAVAEKELAEVISKVLYPADEHEKGKSLRLKQQYFFVSAGLQSIMKRFKKTGFDVHSFHENTVLHINDTHPALAVPELMRLLMLEGLTWDEAWSITTKSFAYTNHTILAEALEKWPVRLFERLLPHIYAIIQEINERFCAMLWQKYSGEWQKISNMAIIAHDEIKMANLAIVAAFSVNGVSGLHTEILKNETFNDFYRLFPEKFISITNGVTHRRFLVKANPGLTSLLIDKIGTDWLVEPEKLIEFAKFAEDKSVQAELRAIRRKNKEALAHYILYNNGIKVDPDSIFDVHIKRLHEYKRQLLNVLHIMHLYNRLREAPGMPAYPRTFIFGAKAAPSYHTAKQIIKLINTVANKVNNDASIKGKLKVVFLENYRVSLAEKIICATDVSEQISLAGKEASGTGNMKFMMNGALTIGTLDGANVEMSEAVGMDNIYIFGLRAHEVQKYNKYRNYKPQDFYFRDMALKQVLDQLVNGFFEDEDHSMFADIFDSLLHDGEGADPYFLLHDFESYCHTQELIGREYMQPDIWWKKSILNIAASGVFSSDRTIREYNKNIWKLPQHDFGWDVATKWE